MSQIIKAPYLREQRNFPQDDLKRLSKECDLAFVDIASKVNQRVIGVYATNFQSITGESWYLTGNEGRQQTIRQVFQITGTGNIAHGLNISSFSGITRVYGTFTDGTNWYPLPYVDVVAANNQVNVYVTPTNIVIMGGAGGGQPTVSSGWVTLELLSNV